MATNTSPASTAPSDQMHLAAILVHGPSPHTIGQWRLPRSYRGFDFSKPPFWRHVARTLERGLFDMVFLADSYSLFDQYEGSSDATIRYAVQYPHHDPLPIVPVMAEATRQLGVATTISTTFLPPYWVARHLATLDHVTMGRVAWNIVTSFSRSEATNFGMSEIPSHEERYEMADEFLAVCKKLWESWERDSVVFDRESGVFADPSKVHAINHVGKHFSVAGPLHVTPSPQGRPLLIQAGSSSVGLDFASRHADVQFAVRHEPAGMARHRKALNERLVANGRSAGDVKILWGVVPIVGETEQEALSRQRAIRENVTVQAGLAMLSGQLNIDLSPFPVDRPLSNLDVEGVRGNIEMILQDFDPEMTLADVARRFGSGIGPHVVGTPAQIADRLQELHAAASGDGFMLFTHTLPGCLDDFVDLVVPELQRRGVFRTEYEHSTLAERFGVGS